MPLTDFAPEADPSDERPPSKTRRKHEMHALQQLGESLVALDARRLAMLDLPERLVDAIAQARSITAHEGRRRQLQYVGKLMRGIEAAPIQATLDQWASGAVDDNAQFAAAERWREELLCEDPALDRFLQAYPGADRARIGPLIVRARAERAGGKGPPHAFRELFRTIRAATSRTE